MFWNGSTAMDGLLGSGSDLEAFASAAAPGVSPSLPVT